MQDFKERREFLRLNALTDIVYNKEPDTIGKALSLSKNISQGGICLIAYEKLNISDLLSLKIYLDEDKAPVQARGCVKWVKEFSIDDSIGKRYDVGVEFLEIKKEDREKIGNYVFKPLK